MSLKPVELQIAVPRSTEAGRIQNELMHRQAADQQQLAGQNVKESREISQRSTEVDETFETAVRDDGRRGQGGGESPHPEQERESETAQPAVHPYKGRRIDLSL